MAASFSFLIFIFRPICQITYENETNFYKNAIEMIKISTLYRNIINIAQENRLQLIIIYFVSQANAFYPS